MADFKPIEPTRDTDQRQQQKLAKKIKNFIYDPSDVIGSGFSSKVYKGINQHNNQQVAIKVIQLSKIQNQVEKYLLNNQINALRALNHKNILKTIDILMTKNNVYIVTEFCQFGDLQQMIKNNKKLHQKDALNIMRDIVEGYIAIQQKNIIHRDLKTANIFLTKTGAKIADFGFCQFQGQKKPQIAYNVGSPAYMSPESYKENKYSNKSDIWGIGIILAEMLIGETPQKNLTYTQMSNNLMNGRINFTENEDIKQILISCFRKDLRERTDARNLLQNILKAIEKVQSFLEDGKALKGSQLQNKFNQLQQITPTEQYQLSSINKEEVDNVRFPTEDKKFITVSPSKINPFRNNNQELTRQFSMIHPVNIEQANRSLSGKKDTLRHSGMKHQFNMKKQLSNKQINFNSLKRLKSSITMLQFVFRLFKYVSDNSLPIFTFLKLILFRHRSYIDQVTENIIDDNKNQLGNHELFKQFQFLKKMFDSTYLDREKNTNEESSHHELMNIMNKLANTTFIDNQSIEAYKDLIKKASLQLARQIDQNRSNAFALWDYLMLEFQILTLYGQGFTDETITNDKINLQYVLKDQPKNISKIHIELLKIKHKYLFEGTKNQFNQIQNPINPIYHQNSLLKQTSF